MSLRRCHPLHFFEFLKMFDQVTKQFPITKYFSQIALNRLESKKNGAKITFFIFFCLLSALVCLFRPDVSIYNALEGPFHLKEDQVAEVVTNFSRDHSMFSGFFQRELFQAELKPDSYRNHEKLLKHFSDPPFEKHDYSFMKIER